MIGLAVAGQHCCYCCSNDQSWRRKRISGHYGLCLFNLCDTCWQCKEVPESRRYRFRPKVQHSSQQSRQPRAPITLGDAGDIETACMQGQLDKAMVALVDMDQQGSVPSVRIYKSLLQACTKRKALAQAKQVHAHLAKHGLESNRFLGDLVVTTLVSCGSLADGLQLFRKLSHRTVFSWTAIISGYSNAGHFKEALSCYEQMQQEGVQPDKYTFVSMLKACGRLADLKQGKRIHADVLRHGLESDIFVSSTLVSMYAKSGSIKDAEQVFIRSSERNLVSWSAMLAGYAQQHQGERALEIYWQMQSEGVRPDAQSVVSALQACGTLAEIEDSTLLHEQDIRVETLLRGKELHVDAVSMGFETDIFVSNSLISMYAKCGSMGDAEQVFNGIQRDLVSWNAMLAAYAQLDRGEQALQIYERMQWEGIQPIARTFSTALQACAIIAEKEDSALVLGQYLKLSSLQKAKQLHGHAISLGVESDSFVCSALISIYAKCGSIRDAEQVFGRLSSFNLVPCNVMLAICGEEDLPEKALQIFVQMQKEGISPDAWTFVSAIQACGALAEKEESALVLQQDVKLESLCRGKEIHAFAAEKGFLIDVFVGNSLISMYAKCGSIKDAEQAFDGQFELDVVSWNALLTAYAQETHSEMAVQVYQEMQERQFTPDNRTLVSVLQACGNLADMEDNALIHEQNTKVESLKQVKEFHAEAVRMGFDSSSFICTTLISVYAKCGSVKDAENVFGRLSEHNLVLWNAMLAAYAEQGYAEKSMYIYQQMQEEGYMPDAWTFVSAFKAWSTLAEGEASVVIHGENLKVESLQDGKEMHSNAAVRGFGPDVFVCNTLISMYTRCGSIKDAVQVFDSLSHPDVVSWNAMLMAYTELGNAEKGLQIFQQMQTGGVRRDARTYVSALQACSILAEVEEGRVVHGQTIKCESLRSAKEIHADAAGTGFDTEVLVSSSNIRTFAVCGSIKDAELVFSGLSKRNLVSWNAMLAAYARWDQGENALQFYLQMLVAGVKPDEVTFLSLLEACANIGSAATCEHIYQSLVETGFQSNLSVATSLIHAFCKCASMEAAERVFGLLPRPDVAAWTAMIAGYARIGDHKKSFQCYKEMCLADVKPDKLTFTALLSACSHAGMVDKAMEFFESMIRDHGISPELEHYGCMIDVVGRAGLYSQAEDLLLNMPMQPDLCVWLCMLGTCRKHGIVGLGRRAFEGAVAVDRKDAAAYVLMSNIYAHSSMWDCAKEIDELRVGAGAWKKPGHSCIEHEQKVHTFLVGDREHQQAAQIFVSLEKLSPEIEGGSP